MIKRIIAAIVTSVILTGIILAIVGLAIWGIDTAVFEVKFYTGWPVAMVWAAIGIMTAVIAVIVFICITKDERKK